jgi:malate/lactate dehydrogenase
MMSLIRFHHELAARSPARTGGPDIMTDYEHVPCPACHGRGHIPVEEAAKIAGVSIDEARRAGWEAEEQEAAELERRVAEAAARLTSLEGT